MPSDHLAAARGGDDQAFARLIGPFRRELRAHCYRMSGSLHDADDLLQESLLRAWKGLVGFAERSSLRTWLYRVTTSACLDALDHRAARTLPAELGPAIVDASVPIGPPRLDPIWVEPCPDELWVDDAASPRSPEARYSGRESVALAFLVTLQLLPPRQRAVLVLRDVLGWQASECAELLDLTVAAINSLLQRARETLEARATAQRDAQPNVFSDATRSLLARYVAAWEGADVSALVALLRDDATLSMPPLSDWLAGAAVIGASLRQMVLTPGAAGHFRLIATSACGLPAFAAYQRDEAGVLRAASLHLLALDGDRIAAITAFLSPSLFAHFGLPAELAATAPSA